MVAHPCRRRTVGVMTHQADIGYDDDRWTHLHGWRLRGGGLSWTAAETLLIKDAEPGRGAPTQRGLVVLSRADRADFYAHDGYKDAELTDAAGVTRSVHIDGAGVMARTSGPAYAAVLYWSGRR